ncbi:MAG: PKD domain-containing protein [Thermoleophilia bacterium]
MSAAPGACVYADDVSVTFSPRDVPPTADLTARLSLGAAALGPHAGPVASHTYTAVGTYTIAVSVQDWNVSGSGTAVGLTRSSPGHSGGSSAQLTNIRLR